MLKKRTPLHLGLMTASLRVHFIYLLGATAVIFSLSGCFSETPTEKEQREHSTQGTDLVGRETSEKASGEGASDAVELESVVDAEDDWTWAGFEAPYQILEGTPRAEHPQQSIIGEVPRPWKEDSSWADVSVRYTPIRDNVVEGESALRMEATRIENGGRVQLAYRDFPLEIGRDIEVAFAAKSSAYSVLQIKVVERSAPYKIYWERKIQLSAEWTEITSRIPGIFEDADTQFQFILSEPGQVDLDAFRFRRVESKDASIDEARVGNLLPQSSFPLGISPPWICQIDAEAVPSDEAGPTGAPALKLPIPAGGNFERSLRIGFSAPANRSVTVSAYLRAASGRTQVALRCGPPSSKLWHEPYQKVATLNSYWQRVQHTLELPVSQDGYYLLQIAFKGEADVLIDGVQIEQAAESPEFKRTHQVEVSAVEVEPYGIYTVGESMRVRWTAYGQLEEAAQIQPTLYDLYGKAIKLPALDVPAKPYQAFVYEVPEAGQSKLGSYRLELLALDAEGGAISVPAEVLLHRVARPRFADQTAPDSYFGIHYTTQHVTDAAMATVKRLGFNWVRSFKSWNWKTIEPKEDDYRFERTDEDLRLMQEHKLMPLAILGFGAPSWAKREGKANGWACWLPENMDDWDEFVAAVFERYGRDVLHYEVWNEQYYASFFTASVEDGKRIIGTAEEYVDMHQRTWSEARKVNRDIQLVWNTNALEKEERTLEQIDLGVLDYTDVFSIHHYIWQSNPASGLHKQIDKTLEVLEDANKSIPIWNTEGGLGPNQVFNLYTQVPPVQEMQHHLSWADWYAKYYLYSITGGVDKFFAYLMAPTGWWRKDYTLSSIDGKLSPNLIAISALAWHIDGTEYVKTIQVGPLLKVHLFEDEGRSVAVLDGPGKRKLLDEIIANESELGVYDLFSNPVSEDSTMDVFLAYVQASSSVRDLEQVLLDLQK